MKRRGVPVIIGMVGLSAWLCAGLARAAEAASPAPAIVQLQDAFSTVAEQAFPAVVVITNKRVENQPLYPQLPPEFRFFFGLPDDDQDQPQPFQRERERPRARKVPQPVGKGSGIVVRADGYILTNFHVIDGSDALEVKLMDGRVFDNARDKDAVKVVGTDEDTDLAIIRIGNGTVKDLATLQLADSDKVKAGQWAIAIGAPFDLEHSVTVGVVSQKGRHDVGMANFRDYIQTDASINPGNSGGPLLDIYGKVIGINNFIMTGGGMSRGSVGVGFAIASNLARQVMDALIEHGTVVRPFLGIGMQELTEDLKKQFNVSQGVLVSEVVKGSPAEKAGIQPGDVVVKVGDKEVRTPSEMLFLVQSYKPGEKVKVTVDRRGKKVEADLVAVVREEKGGKAPKIGGREDLLNQLGLAIEEVEGNVVVSGVVAGSAADSANLRRGDKIIEVNRQPVKNVGDVITALGDTKDGTAVFYVDRRGARFFVPVPLGKEN